MLVETISSVFGTLQLGANSPNSYTLALITRVCVYQTCTVRIISRVTEMQAVLKKSKLLTKQYISCKQTSMRLQGDKSKRGDHDPEALLKWIHSKLPHLSFFHSMDAASCSVFHSSVPSFEYTERQHTHKGWNQHTHPDQSDLSMHQGKTHGLNAWAEIWHNKSFSSSQRVLKKKDSPCSFL